MLSQFRERPGAEDGAGQTWPSHLCWELEDEVPGTPLVIPLPRLGMGSRIQPPLPYPVFVLADLLHLKSLGTLALGHLPGDLPSPTERCEGPGVWESPG